MAEGVTVRRGAVLSADGLYRYTLTRAFTDTPASMACWVMLNPSTADAEVDDATIRRCMSFTRAWGLSWLTVVNLFAFRATNPIDLIHAADPIGPDNDAHLAAALGGASVVVAGWGSFSTGSKERARHVYAANPGIDWQCLSVNKDGQPKHPLYVAGATPLKPWRPA